MKKLLIGSAVLVVVLLLIDRGGVTVAQNQAASKLQSSQGLPERPDVDIAGFPFLTQAARRTFGKVVVTADQVPVGGGAVRLSRLRVVLHDVSVSSDLDSFDAARADADATIGYDELSDTLGIDVGYVGDGRVEASTPVTVAGESLEPTVVAAPSLTDGAIAFDGATLDGVEDPTGAVAGAVGDVFGEALSLAGVPFGVDVESLTVERDGIHLALTGRNLSYGAG